MSFGFLEWRALAILFRRYPAVPFAALFYGATTAIPIEIAQALVSTQFHQVAFCEGAQ